MCCIYLYFLINQVNMTAIVFPGQGSQYVNMSMDFVENFDIALRVFEEIEDITEINIRKIINENPNIEKPFNLALVKSLALEMALRR